MGNNKIKKSFHKRRESASDPEKYSRIQKEIQRQCKCAKELWLEEKSQDIERFKETNIKEMFRKDREIARKGPLPTSRSIRSLNDHIMCETEDIRKRWEEYIAVLFHDDREENDDVKAVLHGSGPSILKEEVQWALKNSKTEKASLDKVVVEMPIALQEDGVDLMWKLFNKIYETGQIPTEMLKSVFIAIPKKPNTLECENHRAIS